MESVAGPSSQKRRHTLAHARWGPVLASLFQEASLAQQGPTIGMRTNHVHTHICTCRHTHTHTGVSLPGQDFFSRLWFCFLSLGLRPCLVSL